MGNGDSTIRVHDSCTADVYFDDYAADATANQSTDLGDIRCAVVANPREQGQYFAFDTENPVQADANHYLNYDDPAGTAVATMDDDYVQQAGKAAVADIADLDSCATIGLAAGDVIDAVNVMIYSLGVGDATAGIRVRSAAGTDYDTGLDDNPIAWVKKYYALDPAGAAWTQTNFDGFQAGKYTASHATNEDLYCVMVFVAYHAAAAGWANIKNIRAGTGVITATDLSDIWFGTTPVAVADIAEIPVGVAV